MQPSADTIIAIFTQFTTTVMPFWLAFVVIFLSNITNGQNASEISDTEAHVNFIGWYANGVTSKMPFSIVHLLQTRDLITGML